MYDIKIDSVKKLWDELLLMMQTQLDVNAFNTFFLPIIPKEIKDNKLLAEAPTRFVKEVVSSEMFLNKINLCLKKITNSELTFEIKETAEFEKENNVESNVATVEIENSLNTNFLFSNFVVGPCNRECYEASMAVAVNPGKFYNPLFIYGRAGIGKTHL